MLEQQPLIAKNKRQKKARKLPDSQNLLQFKELINSACEAINTGIYPSLIYAGSSGSYFVFNMEHQTIGVFKPKNEEPYGKLNPKWLKWLHRIFLPCCFGRSCIIPNKGYLSEAGAYLVDQFLDLQVVPPTFITFLISPTFNYSRIDRSASQARKYLKSKFNALGNINSTLPPKIGSFQKYVEGYSNAYTYFERLNNEPLPPEADNEFHYILEKVIVLDYIIRNTDRSDNWLMKLDTSTVPILSDGTITEEKKYLISVAAIDNGLAFPYKHPDSWRSYPFDWAYIPYAKKPFSQRIKDLVLPKLSDPTFVENLILELEILFKVDRGFDEKLFNGQMAVVRGQIHNILAAFNQDATTPENLIKMNPIYIIKIPGTDSYQKIIHDKQPYFKRF